MSHHVTCNVTVVSCAFFIVQNKNKNKTKEKQNQYKIRKIKENKIKIINVQSIYNIPHAFLAGENVSSPHVLLPNRDVRGKRKGRAK